MKTSNHPTPSARYELLRTTAPYNDFAALDGDPDDKFVGKKAWYRDACDDKRKGALYTGLASGATLGIACATAAVVVGAPVLIAAPLMLHGGNMGVATAKLLHTLRVGDTANYTPVDQKAARAAKRHAGAATLTGR